MAINTAFINRMIPRARAAGNVAAIEFLTAKKAEATRNDFIREAGELNNHPALVNVDHVSFMGMMDRDECERHVANLRERIERAEAA